MQFKRVKENRKNPGASRKPDRSKQLRLFGVGLVGVVLTVACVWVVQRLSDPNLLPLKSVQVEGRFDHVTAEQLKKVVAPLLTEGFFHVDVDVIRAAAEQLPWVQDVSVRRVWPDTLQIKVVEQMAFARWGDKALVNRKGEIFRPAIKTFPQGLPVLVGPRDTQQQLVEQIIAMDELLEPLGLKAKQLVLNERRSWQLELVNGVGVVLGRRDSLQRLQRFVQVYPARLAAEVARIRRVDMRYNNGFAVRWLKRNSSGKVKTINNHA